MKILGSYKNNDYTCTMFSDGTKIRWNDKDSFNPIKPESIDLKITNKCNMACNMCHENSTSDGKHGDILNLPFIDTMFPYSEVAIGGGNPLTHPDLIEFLERLKERKIIASMTVNQMHFMQNIDLLKELTDNKLIYGLGISYIGGRHSNCIEAIKQFPNAVVHVINGIVHMDSLEALANNDLKILILGYKDFRRGKTLYDECGSQIDYLKSQFYDMLPKIVNDGWFKCISFDNLAIKQLEPKRLMSNKDYAQFFMGLDGEYTMYVDAVNRQFAKSSVSTERYDLMDDIADMFKTVKDGVNGK
nr:MAG TPA: tungsten cofactor oxidoreductase radical SAM maturase [Caudoviricetes sp.]